MQRGVREHQPELRRERGDGGSHRRVALARGQHDRPLVRHEQSLVLGRQLGQVARAPDARDHQRERLVLAVLARAQRRHGAFVVCEACEVEAAEPFHRHDGAGAQRVHRGLERDAQLRPAGRAGVGLGVEAAIGRILVLRPARGAHLEAGHRGERPVVRHAAHDREAWSAVGAVDERVAIAPIGRVEQLGQAVVAGGAVRRNKSARLAAPQGALPDLEAPQPSERELPHAHPLHHREWRRLRLQPLEEALHRMRVRLGLDHDSARVVEHVPADAKLRRQPVHERPEAHALHGSLHTRAHATPTARGSCGGHCASSTNSRSRWYALACASWIRGMRSERVTTTWSASCSFATRPPS